MEGKEFKRILTRMCNFCARGEKCVFDITQKLIKLEVNKEDELKIINYLIDNNFINNQRYAEAFVNDKFKFNKWGKQKIRQNLKFKKIESNFIEAALSNLNYDDYIKVLTTILINKRKQIKDKNEFVIKQKLLNHAISKGFEADVIFEVISKHQLSQI